VGKKRFTWLGGLFGFYDNTEREYTNRNLLANSIMSQAETKIQGTGYAAFGQATYSLLDDLHLTFGLRFDHQTLEGDYHNKVNDNKINHQLEFDELLPKITIAYDATQDIMLYATVARGYLVGGYNWSQSPIYDSFHYDPEYSWNYETGIKTTWLDNKLLANLSLFYLKVSDKQVSVTDPDTLLSTVVNAAEASSYGIEIKVTAKPIRNIDVYANIGYNQAKFDEYDYTTMNSDNTAIITQDLSGNYLPYAPEYTYNVGIKYRADSGLMASADWFGTGEMYHNTSNTCKQDPYQIVNLRLGYETKNWEAYVWAKNVFDQHYYTWIHPSGSNLRVFDGEPRTIGVTVAYRF
jgi:iron complex outermembrane receptor protein